MPWVEAGYTETNWTVDENIAPYVHDYYWIDGYTVDDEWSLADDPADTWTPV